jgi:Ni/Fe-hydrogenase subunit HybB-like protein
MTGYAPAADPLSPHPVVAPGETWQSIGRGVTRLAFDERIGARWWIAFAVALALVGLMAGTVLWLLIEGVGIWGNNVPVTWALDIVGYDFWIGIASGGLVVSAVLLLVRAEWRGAVNRIAEAMALVAAAAAGLYPIIHLGRPWFFYWNLPYPNTLLLWPQVRSPLFWDAVDIISYLVVTLSFWYVGMLPDLASMRDRALERALAAAPEGETPHLLRAQIYGIAALGWRGSATHWQRWLQAYRTMAVFAVVLVVSLQTGAAVMFAGTVEPGWHDTLLPVAFLAGAVFAGTGVVCALAVVLRGVFRLDHLVTARHLDLLAMLLLGLGVFNLYCYAAEFLTSWLAGTGFDAAVLGRRFTGAHAWSTWVIIVLALLPVHLFWLPVMRRSALTLFVVGLTVAAGSFGDHFMIIVVTLQHDFLPAAAQPYRVGMWGVATFAGSIGLFLALLLLFLRFLPAVSIVGIRRLVPSDDLPKREAAVHG